jgi:hypothetical protein
MEFQSTPGNMTALLVATLALICIYFMLRKKYDSNLPLIFYFVAVVFSNLSDRGVNPYLLYVGLIFALLLRFEFMNPGFAKIVAYFSMGSLSLIIYSFVAEAFGDGSAPF